MDSLEQKSWYDKTWLVVLLCIVFFPIGLFAVWKNSSFNVGLKIAITIVIGIIVVLAISNNDSTNQSSATVVEKTEKEPESIVQEEIKANWTYSEDIDRMTNVTRYFANTVSTNLIHFEFPYNGGSSFTLTVRQMGNGNEILLQVSKGQFLTSIGSSENVRAKFDDEQPLTFNYSSADDGSSDVIFIDNSSKFLAKLRTSKNLLLEAPFYSAGRQHIEFNVEGLKWDK